MVGAKAACEDAKAQLQVGHTGTGHTRDCVFSLAWRSEGCVELEQRPLSRYVVDFAKQRVRAPSEGTKTVG